MHKRDGKCAEANSSLATVKAFAAAASSADVSSISLNMAVTPPMLIASLAIIVAMMSLRSGCRFTSVPSLSTRGWGKYWRRAESKCGSRIRSMFLMLSANVFLA
jgi:hypothetical protein